MSTIQIPEEGIDIISGVRAKCSDCDRYVYTTEKNLYKVIERFQEMGWEFGTHARCPECAKKQRRYLEGQEIVRIQHETRGL